MLVRKSLNSIKSLWQAFVDRLRSMINDPELKNRIVLLGQAFVDFIRWVIKSIDSFLESDTFKNGVSTARKQILELFTTTRVSILRVIRSDQFKSYMNSAKSQIKALLELAGHTGKLLLDSNILQGLFSTLQTVTSFVFGEIRQNRKAAAGIAALLLVFLIWPEQQEVPEPPVKTVAKEKNTSVEQSTRTSKLVPDFSELAAGSARKTVFFDYFLPIIKQHNSDVMLSRSALLDWYQNQSSLSNNENRQIMNLAAYYRVNDFGIDNNDDWTTLLRRVNVIPASLALAQAANESAWGTSRFAREANNYYGQWCFQAGCGLVPARRDKNKSHEVAAFRSPEESVERYIHNLNSHRAYTTLREIRHQLSTANKPVTGLELAAGLGHYSERGEEYISELQAMIRYNKLTQYDLDSDQS